jgi:hypothetical protein
MIIGRCYNVSLATINKKDLNKQKESNKKLESGITNREKKISHLQNSNLQLEKENLDLKARLEELDKPMSQKYDRFGSATTQGNGHISWLMTCVNLSLTSFGKFLRSLVSSLSSFSAIQE